MTKTYQIKINQGKDAKALDIPQAGSKGQAVTVKAVSGARYQLIDPETGFGPENIRASRQGKDLKVSFEGSKTTDLVIEDYYTVTADNFNGLIGEAESGKFYEYIPENASGMASVPMLADAGQVVGMALGGAEVAPAGAAVGVLAAGLFSPWLLGAGALGLAAAGGGGGGGGAAATTDTTAPTGQTGALSQVSTSDSGKLGDNLTGITKPVITGKAEAGSTVEVTFRDPAGKLTGPYKTTADANGNYSLQVPDSLVDTSANTQGTQYTPVIKATDSAGNSSAVDGTKFVVDTQAAAVTAQIDADANNDGYINAAEKGSATTTSVTVILDKTKMVAGDVITLSDGKNTQTVTLTADDIKAGQVVTKDWALPTAEGQELKVKATMTDLAGNKSSETSDSAVVDTVAPTDVGMISKMSIVTDANDDGWINSSELGVATSFISRATLSNAAKVGDKVIFSAKNDDAAAADQSVMLTNADISKGYVEVSFVQPSEGGKQNVTAKYTDAAGNPATDALLSDQASLSTKGTSNKSVDLVSKITTDVSNDGWVNKSEMGNASSFTSRATFTGTKVTVGDFIVFSASNDGLDLTPINYKLTADDISKGYVDVTFDKPVEGKLQKVTTQYMDKAGNKATDAITDEAKLDSKIPSDIKLTIDLDKDNNGYIKSSEKSTATSLTADFSAFKDSVSVGDILTFKIGTNTRDVTIDAKMLSDGKYMLSGWDQENLPTEGSTMVAQVMLKDAVNATDWFKDTAILDFTGLAFTGQKPDIVKTTDPNTLKSIEFIHPQKEDGSFTLWLTDSVKFTGKIVDGVTKYDSAPANFTSAINVTGNDVHLDFVDLAGNETTSVYALGNIKHVVEPSFAFVV